MKSHEVPMKSHEVPKKSHEVPKVLLLFSAPNALPRLASGVGSGGWMADGLEGRGPAELCSAPGAGAMAAVTWGYLLGSPMGLLGLCSVWQN